MPLSDKGRVILKWTMGIGLPLMTGFAIYEVFVKKLASGKTRFQTWTKKDGVINDGGTQGSIGQSQTTSTPQNTGIFAPPVNVTTPPSSGFPIGIGATGAKVKAIQQYANATNLISPRLIEDGIFGAKTAAAVIRTGYNVPVTEAQFNRMTA